MSKFGGAVQQAENSRLSEFKHNRGMGKNIFFKVLLGVRSGDMNSVS